MGDTPLSPNPITQASDQVVHALIYDVVLRAAKADVIIQAPILGVAPFSWVFDWLWGKVGDLLYVHIANAVSFNLIQNQVGEQVTDYHAAIDNLKTAQNSGDFNAIQKAQDAFREAARKLIHFNGA